MEWNEALQQLQQGRVSNLDLSLTRVDDEKVRLLSQLLVSSPGPDTLNLSFNEITDAGAIVLAQALGQRGGLRELYLQNNFIGDAGAIALAQVAAKKLVLLDLGGNEICDKGAEALLFALKQHSTLSCVNLQENQISEHLMQEFTVALVGNPGAKRKRSFDQMDSLSEPKQQRSNK
eukprot:c27630_g1_i1.p1 GENE.c27630_g1_i1~~c27630_g1_i1.p1  ORF type:complete len:176 (+),score=33.90 c27630_g1_i1:49-576(+)